MAIKILENPASAGIEYQVITESEFDWSSVESGTKFYDIRGKQVYYKDEYGYITSSSSTDGQGTGYKYSEQVFSDGDIRNLNSLPLLILSENGLNDGEYYDLQKMIIEYLPGSTAYNFTGKTMTVTSSNSNGYFNPAFLNGTRKALVILTFGPDGVDGVGFSSWKSTNLPVQLGSDSDATEGDGSVIIKTWYKLRSVGTLG